MGWIRQRPSGRWQATVHLTNGERVRRTFNLRSSARGWALTRARSDHRGEKPIEAAVANLRRDLAEQASASAALGVPDSDWVEVGRRDLLTLLEHAERW